MCFTEQLTNHIFHRYFLYVYVADVAGLQKPATRFCHLCARNLQLNREGCLFGDFPERRQITCFLLFKNETQNFVAGETIDDLCQWTVKKDFAVVDYQHAMTQLLDVLHVMAGEQRHDAMLLIVDAQELADPLLANYVETNGWLIKK